MVFLQGMLAFQRTHYSIHKCIQSCGAIKKGTIKDIWVLNPSSFWTVLAQDLWATKALLLLKQL